jgi:polyisoprenoid-binding protein YceI
MSIERWEIDSSHSGIHFAVRHLVISRVRGRFGRWTGTVLVPDGDWSRATVDVVIDASSIDTGVAARDTHLRAADFLDVKRYPDITFRPLHVTAPQAGQLRIVGELTIKGRVGEVTLEVDESGVTRDPWGNERAGFSARTGIDRRDFGITGNLALDTGGAVIGERIDIEIDVEAVRQDAAVATAEVGHGRPPGRLDAGQGGPAVIGTRRVFQDTINPQGGRSRRDAP